MMIKEYSRKSETYLYRNQKVIYGINIKYFSSSPSLPEATLYVWFYLIVMVAHVRIKTETEIWVTPSAFFRSVTKPQRQNSLVSKKFIFEFIP